MFPNLGLFSYGKRGGGGSSLPTPSMSFNFTSDSLDSSITFTRATTGTYTASSGEIKTAAINAPRFDHIVPVSGPSASLGLLIEEQRTNLFTYSQDFTNGAWVKGTSATILSNTNVAPDGTATADTLSQTTTNSFHSAYQINTITAGQIISLSCYIKAGSVNYAQINFGSVIAANWIQCVVDLSNGNITLSSAGSGGTLISATSTLQANGFYRVVLTGSILTSTSVYSYIGIVSSGTPTLGNFGVETSVGNASNNIIIWGAQLETGSFSTSYIPTVASQVTRAADLASITGTYFSSKFNPFAGTLSVACFHPNITTNTPYYASLIDSSASSNMMTLWNNGSNEAFNVISGGVVQANINSGSTVANNVPLKIAGTYTSGSFSSSLNGATLVTVSSGTIPTVDRLFIGANLTASNYWLNGCIQSINYYPVTFTSSQLIAVTS